MQKLFYCAKADCVLQIFNENFSQSERSVFLSAGKMLAVEDGQTLCIFCQNSFCVCKIGSYSEQVFATKFPNYELNEFVPKKVFVPKFFFSKSFKNASGCVLGEPYIFCVECDGQRFFDMTQVPKNVTIKETRNLIFLQGEVSESDYYVFFHKGEKKFYELCGNVEMSGDKITAIVSKNTLAKHGELLEFEVSEKKFREISRESVYLNKMPSSVPPFLVHIAFFECVREKDFRLARSFLEKDFAERLTDEHFEEFFGKFDKIKPIKENGTSKLALISSGVARVFELKFAGGKICDIVEE